MPTTTAEHNRSLVTPGIYSLLPIRDFLPGALTPADGVMVRTDGCYVAGFHLGGSLTYFGDDAAMNEMKSRVEALLRTFPKRACASSSATRSLRTRTVSSIATKRCNERSPMSHDAWMPFELKDGEKKKSTANS